jgi:hypothetical protein
MAFERFDEELQALLAGEPLPAPTDASTHERAIRPKGTGRSELDRMTDRIAAFWGYREQDPELANAYWTEVRRNFEEDWQGRLSFEVTVWNALQTMGVEVVDDVSLVAPYLEHGRKA